MRRLLGWLIGVAVVAAIVAAMWQTSQRRLPSITLTTGERVSVVGFTYGRKHTVHTWHFDWGFPPVRRITHRYETEADTLVLWLRQVSPRRFASSARILDESGKAITLSLPAWDFVARENVYPHFLIGVPPDGQRLRFQFRQVTPPRSTGELTLQIPRIERALRPQQPEPLPAVREVEGLRVQLDKVEWGCSRGMFGGGQIQPLARPHLRVEPARFWVPLRAVVTPVGAGYHELFTSFSPDMAWLIGSHNLPVYQLVVWLKDRRTGRTKPVKFFIAPPPVEQFKKRFQYWNQIIDALNQADYQNALAICDTAQLEFPDLAAFYRGYTLALKGKYREAIRAWQGLSKPRFTEPWRYDARPAMALCQLLLGETRDATTTARQWRADWSLKERAWQLEYELTLSAASPATAIASAEARKALTFFKPQLDPKNPDYQRRIRAARAIAEKRYRDALNELRSLQIKHLVSTQDRLLMAYCYSKLGDAENARLLREQAENELQHSEHPERWNLRLLGRVLFPKEWRM